jgi:hypothetical protein
MSYLKVLFATMVFTFVNVAAAEDDVLKNKALFNWEALRLHTPNLINSSFKIENDIVYSIGGQDSNSLTVLDDLTLAEIIHSSDLQNLSISSLSTIRLFLENEYAIRAFSSLNSEIMLEHNETPKLLDLKFKILAISVGTIMESHDIFEISSLNIFEIIASLTDAQFENDQKLTDIFTRKAARNIFYKLQDQFDIDISEIYIRKFSERIASLMHHIDISNWSLEEVALYGLNDFQDELVRFINNSATFNKNWHALALNKVIDNKDFIRMEDNENNADYEGSKKDGHDLSLIETKPMIDNANLAPKIRSSKFTVNEGNKYVGKVRATDPEGDSLIYDVNSNIFTINESNGRLFFKRAPDYEKRSFYGVRVQVFDGINLTTKRIRVYINDIDEVPIISGSNKNTLRIRENSKFVDSISCEDPEAKSLEKTIQGIDSSFFKINAKNRILFKKAPDFENPKDSKSDNLYKFILVCSDGNLEAKKTYKVKVINKNEKPVITSDSTWSVYENETDIGSVSATDPENKDLTFSISDNSGISIDSSTGAMSFINAPDYETKTTYSATITVSDGSKISQQDIQINIIDVNEEVTIEVANAGGVYYIDGVRQPTLTLKAGTTYRFVHSAGHPLRFSETDDGAHNGGSTYSDNVTVSSGLTVITITSSTPDTLYYWCLYHDEMGGRINISS